MKALILAAALVPGAVLAAVPEGSAGIDALLERGYAEAGIAPNPEIGDEAFLRRIYLDIAGRIPSLDEARAFLDSPGADRHSRLVDELLASEGYVSHSSNYWADILRISELIGNNRLQTYVYQLWVKDALRNNMPYDRFVRELITARGFLWENGTTGYYHRDRGMPLDNMSNTVRIFLGTRLECAQCHNHPFDEWTQLDYFRMAAFSYGMDARLHAPKHREAAMRHLGGIMEDAKTKTSGGPIDRESGEYLEYRAMGQVISDLFVRLKFIQVRETPETLQLPHDYQYDDAKPHDAVAPATMFGAGVDASGSYDELIRVDK